LRIIELTVTPEGETKIETRGFQGASCRDASRFLEQALGQRTNEQLTAEFHTIEQVRRAARQQE